MKKRMLCAALAALLCLAFAGCGRKPEPVVVTPVETTVIEPLELDRLAVEFVVGDRDPDALLALARDLPAALTEALEARNVNVGEVSVTFGTSAEASVQALKSGSVQVVWLPAEVCVLHDGLRIVAMQKPDGAPRETVGLYSTHEKQEPPTEDDVWAIPAEDELAARYAASMNGSGSLPKNVLFYESAGDVGEADADWVVLRGEAPEGAKLTATDVLALEGEVVAVAADDAVCGGDRFADALQKALSALSLADDDPFLAYGDGNGDVVYVPAEDLTFAALRSVLRK